MPGDQDAHSLTGTWLLLGTQPALWGKRERKELASRPLLCSFSLTFLTVCHLPGAQALCPLSPPHPCLGLPHPPVGHPRQRGTCPAREGPPAQGGPDRTLPLWFPRRSPPLAASPPAPLFQAAAKSFLHTRYFCTITLSFLSPFPLHSLTSCFSSTWGPALKDLGPSGRRPPQRGAFSCGAQAAWQGAKGRPPAPVSPSTPPRLPRLQPLPSGKQGPTAAGVRGQGGRPQLPQSTLRGRCRQLAALTLGKQVCAKWRGGPASGQPPAALPPPSSPRGRRRSEPGGRREGTGEGDGAGPGQRRGFATGTLLEPEARPVRSRAGGGGAGPPVPSLPPRAGARRQGAGAAEPAASRAGRGRRREEAGGGRAAGRAGAAAGLWAGASRAAGAARSPGGAGGRRGWGDPAGPPLGRRWCPSAARCVSGCARLARSRSPLSPLALRAPGSPPGSPGSVSLSGRPGFIARALGVSPLLSLGLSREGGALRKSWR